jgi:hypothetical protein
MRKLAIIVSVVLFAAPMAFAQVNRFTGYWENTNPAGAGVVHIEVTATPAGAVSLHAWGACSPTPCDWGMKPAIAYAPNVTANPVSTARAVSARFVTGFSETLIILKPGNDWRHLAVDTYTHFTDKSGRSPYTMSEIFRIVHR